MSVAAKERAVACRSPHADRQAASVRRHGHVHTAAQAIVNSATAPLSNDEVTTNPSAVATLNEP